MQSGSWSFAVYLSSSLVGRWLQYVSLPAALQSLVPEILIVQLLLYVVKKLCVSPTPILPRDARPLLSSPSLIWQLVTWHRATLLEVVIHPAWLGTVYGVRMGHSIAMRRKLCSSWMIDLPTTWRRCVAWRRWMQSWNAGSESNAKMTSHWCVPIIKVSSTPLKSSNKRSDASSLWFASFLLAVADLFRKMGKGLTPEVMWCYKIRKLSTNPSAINYRVAVISSLIYFKLIIYRRGEVIFKNYFWL